MTEATLKTETLDCLIECRDIALNNLKFYEGLYDDLKDTVERDNIGSAMEQKHAFIGAVTAILKNHDVVVARAEFRPSDVNSGDGAKDIVAGQHLVLEERFYSALETCLSGVECELTVELFNHHLRAAELAVAAIKATSLKI